MLSIVAVGESSGLQRRLPVSPEEALLVRLEHDDPNSHLHVCAMAFELQCETCMCTFDCGHL
jgi:hypothetical protein